MKKEVKRPINSVIAKFKVTVKQPMDFDLSTKQLQEFPNHEQYLYKITNHIVELVFKPTSKTDTNGFIGLMREKLMRQFNTVEVAYVGREEV